MAIIIWRRSDIVHIMWRTIPLDKDGKMITRPPLPRTSEGIVPPIVYNEVDEIWVFYTPQGRLVQSATRDEAYSKWLLTKETD